MEKLKYSTDYLFNYSVLEKINQIIDNGSSSVITYNTYESFIVSVNNNVSGIYNTSSWFDGDNIQNTWAVLNGVISPLNNIVSIPEQLFGSVDYKCGYYNVVVGNKSTLWCKVLDLVNGKEGLGQLDSDGKYDPDVHYNLTGDMFIQDMWMSNIIPIPSRAAFNTDIDNNTTMHLAAPVNRPNEVGERYQDIVNGDVFISTGTKLSTDWKKISLV